MPSHGSSMHQASTPLCSLSEIFSSVSKFQRALEAQLNALSIPTMSLLCQFSLASTTTPSAARRAMRRVATRFLPLAMRLTASSLPLQGIFVDRKLQDRQPRPLILNMFSDARASTQRQITVSSLVTALSPTPSLSMPNKTSTTSATTWPTSSPSLVSKRTAISSPPSSPSAAKRRLAPRLAQP